MLARGSAKPGFLQNQKYKGINIFVSAVSESPVLSPSAFTTQDPKLPSTSSALSLTPGTMHHRFRT